MAAEKPLSQIYLATKKLLDEQPHWASIITACVQLSEESTNGVFWSSAALNRSQQCGHGYPFAHLASSRKSTKRKVRVDHSPTQCADARRTGRLRDPIPVQ